jgi:CRP/FNR family transcriptional regulator, cyclic AMP receptor protein
MKVRFEGKGKAQLIEQLARQQFAGGDKAIAKALQKAGQLKEFKAGDQLIREGGEDNDVFLIVAGTVSVVVKGQEVRTLAAGDHVGEMAAIEPAQKRSATVIAVDTVVAVKMAGPEFVALCDEHPIVWKPIARELGRRLFDRNRLMETPNERPRLFIVSSVEALDIARELATGLHRDALPTVWTDGVFWASKYPLESLEKAVNASDFGIAVAMFEDTVQVRGETKRALRDNVLFELGMFIGKLGRHRTFLVHPRQPDLTLPTDLNGLTPVAFDLGKKDDLPSLLGPACHEIRKRIEALGVKTQAN